MVLIYKHFTNPNNKWSLSMAVAEAIVYLAKYFLLFLAGIRKDYDEM
jgi:hypothetical protein